MISTPSRTISAGPAASHPDHDDLAPNIIAASFTTWAIACVFVLLRFWARGKIVRVLGLSDLFIALSLVAALGMCISILLECVHGRGKHIYHVDLFVHGIPLMKAWWFSLLFYSLSLASTKVSICLLYLTIFTFERIRKSCYVVLVIVVLSNLLHIASTLTYCVPLQSTWDPAVKATFCQSQDAWWANTALVIATDLLIFILPIPIVVPLKLPLRQKLVLVAMFTVGFFVCLVSLIRLAIMIQAKAARDPDFTYATTHLNYWTAIEVHTAIAVACIMTLKPLVTKFFPRLLSPQSTAVGDSNRPPPTIGSAPSRPPPGTAAAAAAGMDDVVMRDIEQQAHPHPHPRKDQRQHQSRNEEEGEEEEEQKQHRAFMGLVAAGRGERGRPPAALLDDAKEEGSATSVRSDGVSERTEELGREITARSIG